MKGSNRLVVGENPNGVCDRLSGMMLAYTIGKVTSRQARWHWMINPGCGSSFDRLFQSDGIQVTTEKFPTEGKILARGNVPGGELLHRAIVQHDEDVLMMGNRYFGHNFDSLDRVVKLSDLLELRFSRFLEMNWGGRVVGVHVRRADKLRFGAPDLRDYFERLDPVSDNTDKVFLATDDAKIISAFQLRYGKKLIIFPVRSLNRNSPDAIEDAVLNLYLLRRSDGVIGSAFSGFSLCAGWDCGFLDVPSAKINNVSWRGESLLLPCSRLLAGHETHPSYAHELGPATCGAGIGQPSWQSVACKFKGTTALSGTPTDVEISPQAAGCEINSISYAMCCHHQEADLKSTLELTLKNITSDSEVVVLDCAPGTTLEPWIRDNLGEYLDNGQLRYIGHPDLPPIGMAEAKNLCHLNCTKGIVCNLDPHHWITASHHQWLRQSFESEAALVVTTPKPSGRPSGRVALRMTDFIRIGGYDITLTHWDDDGLEITSRAILAGCTLINGGPESFNIIPDFTAYRPDESKLRSWSDKWCSRYHDVVGLRSGIWRSNKVNLREAPGPRNCLLGDSAENFAGNLPAARFAEDAVCEDFMGRSIKSGSFAFGDEAGLRTLYAFLSTSRKRRILAISRPDMDWLEPLLALLFPNKGSEFHIILRSEAASAFSLSGNAGRPESSTHTDKDHLVGRVEYYDGLPIEAMSWMIAGEGYWDSFDLMLICDSPDPSSALSEFAIGWKLLKVGGALLFAQDGRGLQEEIKRSISDTGRLFAGKAFPCEVPSTLVYRKLAP